MADTAFTFALYPYGHVMTGIHALTLRPLDHYPLAHGIHPSVTDVAPVGIEVT